MRNLVLLIIASAIIGSLGSCSPSKKLSWQQKKAQSFFSAHPDMFAGECAIEFPIQTHDSVIVKEGVEHVRHDTVKINIGSYIADELQNSSSLSRQAIIDSLRLQPFNVAVPCPPCPFRVDTFKSYSVEESSAWKTQAELLATDTAILNRKIVLLNQTIKSKSHSLLILSILFFLILGIGGYKIVKLVNSSKK
jgi:hypothetical protein